MHSSDKQLIMYLCGKTGTTKVQNCGEHQHCFSAESVAFFNIRHKDGVTQCQFCQSGAEGSADKEFSVHQHLPQRRSCFSTLCRAIK